METGRWTPFDYELEDAKKKVKKQQRYLVEALQKVADIEARMNDPMTWSIDHLAFSVRTWNCLARRASIVTVKDLVQRSPSDLLRIEQFGRKCLAEVEAVLSDAGLSLAGKEAARGE